jgi:hypothetical protein
VLRAASVLFVRYVGYVLQGLNQEGLVAQYRLVMNVLNEILLLS